MGDPKFDLKEFGRAVHEDLKAATRGKPGIVHADLSGRVLDAKSFEQELDENEEFAKEQIRRLIDSAPSPKPDDDGSLSPDQQRQIAEQVSKFHESSPGLEPREAFVKWIEKKPLRAVGLTPKDCTRIAESLDIEKSLTVDVPSESDLERIRHLLDDE
jgi:hypothetical protein